MAPVSLSELTSAAATSTEPTVVSRNTPRLGGVDPLGLRQINFDLMDQVLPGLNNVARHIRPFVVTTWAWRRAGQLAESLGTDKVLVERLQDFVDRIEVIYSWSQFLRNPAADLPGRDVLKPLIQSDHWRFGGSKWLKRREARKDSTAFSAAVNYGPALKTLGWLSPHRDDASVRVASDEVKSALDAFEAKIAKNLSHPAFSKFGTVEVTAKEAEEWADRWALDQPTLAEKRFMSETLLGSKASPTRRKGCELMLAAAAHAGTSEVEIVRRTMSRKALRFSPSGELDEVAVAWRRVQVRQLFRLSLEALFFWIIAQLAGGPRPTEALVDAFIDQVARAESNTALAWLNSSKVSGLNPVTVMDRITKELADPGSRRLASTIADGLAFSLTEAPKRGQEFERNERLPLVRAGREMKAWGKGPTRNFVKHVLESWVLAQHVFWSVGRGLADARSHGKTILRLKVVMEEGGWTLAPGVFSGASPRPTPDRLETALSLAGECGHLRLSS